MFEGYVASQSCWSMIDSYNRRTTPSQDFLDIPTLRMFVQTFVNMIDEKQSIRLSFSMINVACEYVKKKSIQLCG